MKVFIEVLSNLDKILLTRLLNISKEYNGLAALSLPTAILPLYILLNSFYN